MTSHDVTSHDATADYAAGFDASGHRYSPFTQFVHFARRLTGVRARECDLGRRRLDRGLADALSLRRERSDHVALVVKRVWAIRLQCLHRNVNVSQRYHAVERVMIVSDRYRELRDGLPSVLDKRGCLLWEQHQNSWRHHACGELRCRCTRHDSDFGVRPRRQGFD